MNANGNVGGNVSSNAGATPVQYRKILVHRNPHLDEIMALFLLRNYGEGFFGNWKFPGVSTAVVEYHSELLGDESSFRSDGMLPVGLGEGFAFNEHTPGGRIPGECAATLVATGLGIRHKWELEGILAEVLRCDESNGCFPTMLPELIKAQNRRNMQLKDPDVRAKTACLVMRWSNIALAAIVKYEPKGRQDYYKSRIVGEKSLMDFFQPWVSARVKDQRVVDRMSALIRDSMRGKDQILTEVAHIVEALQRTGTSSDDVADWCEFTFTLMAVDQTGFWGEVDRLKNILPIDVTARVGTEDKTTKFLVVDGSNVYSQKAARYLGNKVVLVRDPVGNVQILVDERLGLDLTNVVRMVRFQELPYRQRDWRKWMELGAAGDYPLVPNWHYFRKGQMLFNGSHTHQAVPTRQSLKELISAVTHGFHPDKVKEWCRKDLK